MTSGWNGYMQSPEKRRTGGWLLVMQLLLVSWVLPFPLSVAEASSEISDATTGVLRDVIRSSDPSACTVKASDPPQGQRSFVFLVRPDEIHNAWLFTASCDGSKEIEIQLHPDSHKGTVGESNKRLNTAQAFGKAMGQLPRILRSRVQHIQINPSQSTGGRGLAHGSTVAIHGPLSDNSSNWIGVLAHEAAHVSLDWMWKTTSAWKAAQRADGGYISGYAREYPNREDIAESFPAYLAYRFRPERIRRDLEAAIFEAMPNRIAFFDAQLSADDMRPFAMKAPQATGVVVYSQAMSLNAGTDLSYQVRLASPPGHDVKVTPTSGDPGTATITSAPLTFTKSNWHIPQLITVNGVAAGAITISHTTKSPDASYNDLSGLPEVSVTVSAAGTLPVFNLSSNKSTVVEGGNAEITISLSGTLSGDVILPALVGNGPGITPEDYSELSTRRWTTRSHSESKETLETLDDDEDEPTETMTVRFNARNFPADTQPGTTAMVMIVDNDPTRVTLLGTGDVAEGRTKELELSLGRELVAGEILPVPLTFGGDATRGGSGDYTLTCAAADGVHCSGLDSGNARVTFTGPSARSVVLTLMAREDGSAESAETVDIGLGTLNSNTGTNLGGGAVGVNRLGRFHILEASAKPTVSLSVDSTRVAENEEAIVEVTAVLSKPLNADVSIPLVAGGTAVAAEYQFPEQGITVRAGETRGSAQVTLLDDAVDELTETLTLTLGTLPANVGKGQSDSVGIGIVDDDPTTVTLSDSGDRGDITEGETKTFKLTLGRPLVDKETLRVRIERIFYHPSDAEHRDYTLACGTAAGVTCDLSPDNVAFVTFTGPSAREVELTATAVTIARKRGSNEEYDFGLGEMQTNLDGGVTGIDDLNWFKILERDEPVVTGKATVTLSVDHPEYSTDTQLYTRVTEGEPIKFTVTLSRALAQALEIDINFGTRQLRDESQNIKDNEATFPSAFPGRVLNCSTEPRKEPVRSTQDPDDYIFIDYCLNGRVDGSENLAQTLTIPAMRTVKTFTMVTYDDMEVEGNEYFRVALDHHSIKLGEMSLNDSLTHVTTTGEITKALVTIEDNDVPPEIGISSWLPVVEGGKAIFTVRADRAVNSELVVNLVVSDAPGSDFVVPGNEGKKTVTILKGERLAVFTVDTEPDATDEADGEVKVAVVADTNDPVTYTLAAAESATVEVQDDDDDEPTLSIDSPSVTEGDSGTTDMTFTVTLSPASSDAVSVAYADAKTGTATSATDYTAIPSGTLSFAANETEKTVTVKVNGDTTAELNETIILQLSSPSNARLSGGATTLDGTGTITDDDDATEPTVSVADPTAVSEGDDPAVTADMTFTVSLSETSSKDVIVPWTLTGTATDGSDYDAPATQSLTIAAGQSSGEIVIPVKGDTIDEIDETIIVTLGKPTNATVSTVEGAGTATGTITDDDATTVTLGAPTTTIDENAGTKTITVTLGRTLTGDETLDVPLTFAGTATFGDDYTLAEPNSTPTGVSYSNLASSSLATSPPTITFSGVNSAASSATVILTATNDTIDEGETESVTVGLGTLNANSGTNLGGGASGSGTSTFNITDDDERGIRVSPVTLTLDEVDNLSTQSITEHQKTYTVELDSKPTGTVTVNLGGDTDIATLSATSLEFTASDWDAQTVTVTAVNDDIDNAGGERTVTITHTVSATGTDYEDEDAASVEVTVTDDDTRGVTVVVDGGSLSLAEVNSGGKENEGTYTVVLDSEPTHDVVVNLTRPGLVTVSPTSLTFTSSNWDDAQTVTVTAVNDDIDNVGDARTGSITHTVVAGSSDYGNVTVDSVAVTVTDDDSAPTGITLSVDIDEVAEDAGKTSVTVTATVNGSTRYSDAKTVTVTVGDSDDSAASGTDYANVTAFNLVIPAGDASVSKSFDLTPTDDSIDEVDETISITGESGSLTIDGDSITLTDDDVPEISISAGSAVTEGTAASFTVDANIAPATALTVKLNVVTTDSFAASGTTGDKTLTFRAGSDSETYTVNTQSDTTDEVDGSVTVTVQAGTDYTVDSSNDEASVDVNDDDATPTVTLALTPASIAEDGGATTVTATLSGASSQAVMLTVSAPTSSDYALSENKVLTIAAGATTSTGAVTLTAVDNDVDAANKTVTVSATASGGNGVAAPSAVTLTINDDDTRGVTVVGGPLSMDEVDTAGTESKENEGTYTVVLTSEPTDDVRIDLAAPNLVTLSPASLTFTSSNWNQAQTVTVTAVNDDTDNAGDVRTGHITHAVVAGSSDYTGVNAANVSVTVNDEDGEPTLSIDAPTVTEGDSSTTTLTFKITLSPASGKPVSVAYADATTGTATSATDYAAISSGTLNFAAGETEKTIDITVNGDEIDEPDETIVLRLSSPSNATFSGGSTTLDGTGMITDNDAAPTVSVGDAVAVTEGDSGTRDMSFEVSLSAASGRAITVPYTLTGTGTGGSDYETPASTSLSIPAGDTRGTIIVKVKGDTLDELNETVIVTLGVPTHATVSTVEGAGTGTGTITDDDAAEVSVSNAPAVEEGNDPDTTVDMSFAVSLSVASVNDITVPYTLGGTATGGSDYETPASTSLSIPAGDTRGTIVIKVKGDALDEPNETVIVTLGAPTHATVSTVEGADTGTGTITDDDGTPGVTLKLSSANITESGASNSTTVTATLSSASSHAVTLTVSAVAVSPAVSGDFVLSGATLTIAAGATTSTGTVTITAVDNEVDAANKTVTVSATAIGGNGVAAPSDATLTITDDDTRGVTLAGDPLSMDEADNTETESTTENQDSYTVVLDSKPTNNVQINLTAPNLVTLSASSLTFTPSNWNQAQTVTATAVDDTIDNPGNERTGHITHAVVAGSSDYDSVTVDRVAVTVNDNDTAPDGITLSVTPEEIAEDAGKTSVTVTATVNGSTRYSDAKTVTVTVGDSDDSAVSGTDYTPVSTFDLVIPAGDASVSKSFDLTPTDDSIDEVDETISITGASGSLTVDGTRITITDDDVPEISISAGLAVDEGTAASFTVNAGIAPAANLIVNVDVDTTAGFAASGTTGRKTFTFRAGRTSETYTVNTQADTTDEPDGSVTVTVQAGTDYTVSSSAGSDSVAVNDDDATTVTLARAGSGGIAENAGTEDITITLGRALVAGESVTVPLAVTGATVSTHYTLGLKGNGGTGVSLTTTSPHNAQNPSVKLTGAGARTATLTLTAVANSDNASRTVAIAYGTSTRAPSSSGLSGGISTSGTVSVPILDDDAQISVTAASAAEGSAVVFTVTLPDPAPSGGVTIDYSTSNGRGNNGDTYQVATSADYTAASASASITIAQGQRSGSISIPTTQDTTYEGDHYFTLTLDSTDTYNISDSAGSAIGTITDVADTPTFAFSAASTDADEDDGTLTLTIEKTGTTLVDSTVSYATTNGSATGGSDFTAITSTNLDFAAGDTSKDITVTITDDSADEADEAFTVDLTAGADAKLGSTARHSINITDNDATTVTLGASATAIDENAGTKTITVTLGRALTGDETLDVPLTFAGTATFGTDYTLAAPSSTPTGVSYSNLASSNLTASPPTITFSGVDSATVILTATNDTTDEGATESVTVGLGTLNASSGENLDGGASGSGTATFNITDDEAAPTVTLALSPASIDEDGGATTVTATLSPASSQAVTLTVSTTAVSPAVAGDFTLSGTTLTIAAGSTTSSGAVTITAVDNKVDAANKTVTVSATASGGNGVAAPADVTLTINDDDTRGVTVVADPLTLAEVDNTGTADSKENEGTYTVVLTSKPTDDVQITLTAPGMVTLSPTSLTFTPSNWNVAQTVTVTSVNDDIDNTGDARTGSITHTVVAGSSDYTGVNAASVSVTVNDDEGESTLSIDSPSVSEGDSSTVTLTFKVTLAPASGSAVSVDYADAGTGTAASATDYAAITAGTLTFTAGQTEKTVAVTVNGDTIDEPHETVVLRLSSASGAKLSGGNTTLDGTGTINDDDDLPTATLKLTPLSGFIAENGGSSTVTAELSGASSSAVTLTVSVPTSSDYALSENKVLTIAAGATTSTGTVTITAVDNKVDAANKTVTVSATASGGNGVAAPADVTLTINDDDTRGVTVTSDPLSLAEVDNTGTSGSKENEGTYTVVLDSEPTNNVQITLTAPGMVTLSPTSLTFTPSNWNVAQTVTVTSVNDDIDNTGDARTGSITHTVVAGSSDYTGVNAASVSVTVNDDEGESTLSIDSPSVSEGDSSTVTLTFKVTLAPASGSAVSVDYADAGTGTAASATDYAAITAGTLTFTAGQTEKTVAVTVNGDTIDEPHETVVLRLSSASGAKLSGGNTTLDGTGTINDDDDLPTATLKLTPLSGFIAENGGSSTVTAELSGASSSAVTLTVSVPTSSDYALSENKVLTIAAGATTSTGTVTITAVDNKVDAANKTVTVSATASGGNGVAAPADVTLTINDDDTRGVTVVADPLTLAEVDNTGTSGSKENEGTYTVVLDSEPTNNVQITLTAPGMVTLSPTSLTFTPSNWNVAQTVTVTSVNDDIDNTGDARTGSITHTVVAGSSDYTGVNAASVSVTVNDDEGESTLSIDSPSVSEGDSSTVTLTFKVTLAPASGSAVSVDYADAGTGTAASATDYAAITAGTLTFTAGQTEKTVAVTVNGDTIDEPHETVVLRLSSASGAKLSGGNTTLDGTGTINDDDDLPTATLKLTPLSGFIAENGGSSTVTAELSGASSSAVTLTVSVPTSSDYALSENKVLTIAAGATTSTGTVTITAVDNKVDAANKTVTVSATASGGNGVAAPADVTLTINDDDTRGVTVVADPLTLAEVDNTGTADSKENEGTYTVVLDSEPTANVVVNMTRPGMVTVSPASLTFTPANWSQAQTVTVTSVNDDIDNVGDARTGSISHTVVAGSSDYTGVNAASVSVTVNDDEGESTLSIDSPSVSEGDSSTATLTFKVTLAPASASAVSVDYADAGTGTAASATDYAAITSGTLTFAAGQTEKTVTVTVNGDTTDEPNETIVLRLSSPSNARLSGGVQTLDGTGTINDDDATPTVTLALSPASIDEDGGSTSGRSTVTATLSGASSQAVTLTVAAAAVSPAVAGDFTLSGATLTIAAGVTASAGTVTITAVDNAVDAADKTVTVSATASGGNGVSDPDDVSLTITDDDVPELSIAAGTAVTEGTAASFTVNADIAPAADLTVNVDVDTTAGFVASGTTGRKTLTFRTGRTSETYTVNTQADTTDEVDGSVTVTVQAGTDYTVDSSNDEDSVAVNDDDATTVTLARAGSGGIAESAGTEDITVTLGRALVAGESVTVPLAVTGATVSTHYRLALKGSTTGVSLDTTSPHNAQNPAITLSGAGARTATLTLTAVANSDNASRTVAIAYGTSSRAPTSSGLSGGISTSGTASVPILDDDAQISVTAASAAEGSAVVFTVTLPDPAPSGGVTIDYSTTDGRGETTDATYQVATSADYTAASASASITIAANGRSGSISIPTTQDSTYEGDHYFTLTLESTDTFNISDSASSAIGTITDAADTPSFEFSAASTNANEGDGTVTLTIEKTGTTLVGSTVSYATTNGSATGGSDFTAITSTNLNFAAGDTSQDITVTITDDSADETTEAFTVDLTAGADAKLGSTTSHSISITDNDATTVSLDAPSAAIGENAGTKTITVTLGRALEGDETLAVPLTFAGTATFGTDYTLAAPNSTPTGVSYSNLASGNLTASPPTLTFSGVNSAASSATVILTATNDTIDEGATESVTVGLGTLNASSGENLDGGASRSGTATFNITDDEATPTVALALSPASIAEDGGVTTVTATLSPASSQAVTLTVAAANSSDYTLSSNKILTIAAGATTSSGTVTITAVDNAVDAPNKTVTVSATASGGNGVSAPDDVSLTITDDDGTPTATLKLSSSSITENGGSSTVTATLSSASSQAVTLTVAATAVSPAVAGDFTLSGTTLTIAAGATESSGTVTLTAQDNDIDAANKTVTVSATASGGGVADPTSQTLTITDDDTRGVTVTGGPLSLAEVDNTGTSDSKENEGSYTVVLDSKPTNNVQITLTAPDMVNLSASSLTFTPSNWNVAKTVTVTSVNDDIDNVGDVRTGSITHTVVAGSSDYTGVNASSVSVTVNDDEGESTLSIDSPSVTEGNNGTTTLTFKVTLAPASDDAVSVSYADAGTGTATSATDYVAITSGTLTFTAGQTEKTVTVTVNGDTTDEPNETIVLRLSSPSNARLSGGVQNLDGTGTITNDDTAPTGVTLSVSPDIVHEDNSTVIAVTATLVGSPRSEDTALTISVDPGTAQEEDFEPVEDFTLTILAGASSRQAEFTLTPVNDRTDEEEETIIVSGTSTLDGFTVTPATVYLQNYDPPASDLSLVLLPTRVSEGGGTQTVTVIARFDAGTRSVDTEVNVTVESDTATETDDFKPAEDFTLTILANQTQASHDLFFTPVNDSDVEGDEAVTISGSTTVADLNLHDATLTIEDDDDAGTPTATLVLSRATISENGGLANLSATLSAPSSQDLTLTVSAHLVSPTTINDFSIDPNPVLTIVAGETESSGVVTIEALDNSEDHAVDNRQVRLSASVSGGHGITDPDEIILTIQDDDEAGVNFSESTIDVEKDETMVIQVRLTSQPTMDTTVTLTSSDPNVAELSASPRGRSVQLLFTPQNWNVPQSVTIHGMEDGDLSITTSIQSADMMYSNAIVPPLLRSNIVVVPDLRTNVIGVPTTPELSLSAGSSVEEGESARFVLMADPAPQSDLTIAWTVAQSGGYLDTPGAGQRTATLAAGATTLSLLVTTVDDELDEPDGSITVTLNAGTGYTVAASPDDTATVAVSDNDTASPVISVGDVSVQESQGVGYFTVTMSEPVGWPVRFYYATRDSEPVSARANQDYQAYDRTLRLNSRFEPGETEVKVHVQIMDDSHDEDAETFEIELLDADMYDLPGTPILKIADSVAVITIVDDDQMPAAWLARFGRSVAQQALDGIAGRIEAPRTAGTESAFAGISTQSSAFDNDNPGSDVFGGFDLDGMEEDSEREYRSMTMREALMGSSFTTTSEQDATGGSLAFWGRAAEGSFGGNEGDLSLDGETTSALLGMDYARDNWMGGVSLIQSSGKGGYTASGVSSNCPQEDSGPCAGGASAGTLESSLTALVPYTSMQVSDRMQWWGALGHGIGEVDLKPGASESLTSDISWNMAAIGLRGDVIQPSGQGLSLSLTSDALWTRTSSQQTDELAASDSDTTRLRLGLESSWAFELKDGGQLTPKLEMALRQDGGDAETGGGVEIGGGISWLNPGLGLSLDLSGRTLVSHGDDDFEDRGFAASLEFDPDPSSDRSPSLTLRQDWGNSSGGGLDAMFTSSPVIQSSVGGSQESRWTAEAAWGFPALGGRFTGSPHAGLGFSGDSRDFTVGWRLTQDSEDALNLSLGVQATRRENGTDTPKHSAGFEMSISW